MPLASPLGCTNMGLPKVLCIGAQKAGTSWLHENLKSNQGAWLPPFKELHFLDHKFLPANRRWTKAHVVRGLQNATLNAQLCRDIEKLKYLDTLSQPPLLTRNWYRRVFSSCPDDKVGIDVTPEYASIPSEGIVYARELLGENLRIIFLVRDPVERALSQMRMYIGRRKKIPSTPAAWEELMSEPDLRDRGNYLSHIPRWEAIFPLSSMLYIPFGRIANVPCDVLNEVEEFCGLPKATYPRANERVYAGPPVEFPKDVVFQLENILRDQTDFLVQRFGRKFSEETRS